MDLLIPPKRALAFRQMLDTIKDLSVTDINVCLNSDGINIQTLDISHVSVILLKLEKTYFDKYDWSGDTILGLNLNILTKILKPITKLDSLQLCKKYNQDTLTITILNETRTQTFIIPLFDFITDELKIPAINYSLVYKINSDEFSNLISDISLVKGPDIT